MPSSNLFPRTLRRAVLAVAFFTPLILSILAFALVHCSARTSLAVHGHPFARIVPKEDLDIFQFLRMDSFACQGIAFEGKRPVGWICRPTGSFPYFVPFSSEPFPQTDEDDFVSCFRFLVVVVIAYLFRWPLLAVQLVFILWWLRPRGILGIPWTSASKPVKPETRR